MHYYNSKEIAQRIKQVAKDKGIVLKDMLTACGLGENTLQNMKKSMPKTDTLAMIADFLHVSVDFLLGRDPTENANAPIVTDRSELADALSKLSPSDTALMTDLAAALAAKSRSQPPQGDQ